MKKIIVVILSMISLFLATTSAQYLYFSGNGSGNNGFQQGCWETLGLYHTGSSVFFGLREKGVTLSSKFIIDSSVLEYDTQVKPTSFSISNEWIYVDGFPKTDDNNRTYIQLSNSGDWGNRNAGFGGNLIFRPKYNTNSELSTNIFFSDVLVYSYIGANSTGYPTRKFDSTITGKTISIVKAPCVNDTTRPSVGYNYISGETYKINSGLIITLTDSIGVTGAQVPFVYTGNNIWTGSYTGNPYGVNNQYGVNIDNANFKVTVSGGSGDSTLILKTGNFSITTGATKTWQYKDRDYTLTNSLNGFDFGVEKSVTITVEGLQDRAPTPNPTISNLSITFNKPKPPYVVTGSEYPQGDKSYIPYLAGIEFDIKDDWAGVSGESITVVLSGINGTDYFDDNVSLDLTCLNENESDCGTLGKNGGYHVVASHTRFPGSGNIQVIVNASDLGGESMQPQIWSFQAAPVCSEMAGCCDPVEIWYGEDKNVDGYTGGELTISGANVTVSDFEEYTLSGVTYTGWIFEVDCHQADSALSLYRGTESDNEEVASGLLLDELVLSGANPETIKAELDGNQLTLSYWVDGAEITQISPEYGTAIYSNSIVVSRNFEEMNNYDWISGFVLTIYTGNNPENIVRTGFKEWASVQEQYQYAFEEVPVSTDYYRSIYIIDKAGRTGESISTGYFECLGVPSGTVEFSNLKPNTGAPKSDFDFEWTASLGEDTSISGYRVQLYTGDSCDNEEAGTEIWSGNVTTGNGGDISIAYTGDPLTSLQQYCWKVSAMKGNRAITGSTATFTGMMEIIVKAELGDRGSNNNESTGEILFYNLDDKQTPIYSGYMHLNNSGTGKIDVLLGAGNYYVVYKSWQHLAVYTGVTLGSLQVVIDLTTASGTDVNGLLIAGDLPNSESKYNDFIDAGDLSVLYDPNLCPYADGQTYVTHICDLNHDGEITATDASIAIVNSNNDSINGGVVYFSKLFGGFGPVNYWELY